MDLSAESPGTEDLIVFDVKAKQADEGYRYDTKEFHLFCRNADGEPRHVVASGFRPVFYVSYSTFVEHYTGVLNDRRVIGVDVDLTGLSDGERRIWRDAVGYCDDEDWTPQSVAERLSADHSATVYDNEVFDQLGTAVGEQDRLVRIVAKMPGDVGGGRNRRGLRDDIQDNWGAKTWEADIPFERRFLISAGVHRGLRVPDDFDDNGVVEVRYENWDGASTSPGRVQEIDPIDPPVFSPDAARSYSAIENGVEVTPRVLTVDIEVATHGGGVPNPIRARNEVTAITAHDSYNDEYRGWFLASDEWDEDYDGDTFEAEIDAELGLDSDVSVWDNETAMLDDFNQWVVARRFDLITGWNSESFDYPYLIQRSYEIDAWEVIGWDQLGNPGVWRDEDDYGGGVNYKVDGTVCWDMLDGYKKTLFRDVSSYRLEDVANEELGYGKAPIDDIDEAWHHDPIAFAVYNTRDVEAVVEIERASELLDLYEHMRQVTGADLVDCHTNGPMIDTLFLRHAYDKGIALPTNVKPDVGDFHGAHVFDPVPGVHRNVIYPDLSSLYPYLIWTLNVSPEVYIHDSDELERSEYTEDDVFTVYVDKRGFDTIPKGQDAGPTNTNTDKYKGVVDESNELRDPGMFDPRYDVAYMVKPTVEEGFIRETVDELVDMKYEYKGEGVIYDAVKRVTNSVWGVLGDSASMGQGFRLFDWRLGEVITLGGRKVIQYTAGEYVRLVNEFAEEDGYEPLSYLVGGDTDSCQSSIPMAPDFLTAIEWAHRASEHFLGTPGDPGLYDVFMQDEFDVIIGEDEHRMDVEVESLASKMFFKESEDEEAYVETPEGYIEKEDSKGVKKRYVEHEIWGDSHGWIDTPDADEYRDAPHDPEDISALKHLESVTFGDYEAGGVLSDQDPEDNVSVTGFEYVRSDIAPITAEAQMNIFTSLLLSEDYEDEIYTYLEGLVDDVKSDRIPLHAIARTQGVGKDLDDYGWKNYDELRADENYTATEVDERNGGRYVSTPGPTYRGLKYAIDHFQWQEETKKPTRIYIENVESGEHPEIYTYSSFPKDGRPDPPEVGRPVDAVAVDEPERLPDQFHPDYDKMLNKELRDNVSSILETVGMSWSSVIGTGRQSSMDQFF